MGLTTRQVRAARKMRDLAEGAPDSDLDRLAAEVACAWYGCPDQPRAPRHMKRHETQPWRCERCKTWWITIRHEGYEYVSWEWKDITGEIQDQAVWDKAISS